MKTICTLFFCLAVSCFAYSQSTVSLVNTPTVTATGLSGTAGSLTRMTTGTNSTFVDIGPMNVTGGAYFRISNSFGTLDVGPQSSSNWCHMITSKDYFYFNKPVTSATGAFGSYSGTDLLFYTGMASTSIGSLRMTILQSNGYVGLGVSTPTERLDVMGNVRINNNLLYFRTSDNNHGIGYNASGFTSVNGPVLFGYNGGLLASTTGAASTPALRWDNNGNVTIGSATAASACKLTVTTSSSSGTDNMINVNDNTGTTNFRVKANGFVYARDITVQVSAFPDYVFDSTYQLLPLQRLDAYIAANHHLPGIPTAAAVQQNGMSVGEMNVLLLQKVEELTLYVIDLQQQIDTLKQQ